jgi:hypothetical protein
MDRWGEQVGREEERKSKRPYLSRSDNHDTHPTCPSTMVMQTPGNMAITPPLLPALAHTHILVMYSPPVMVLSK